MTHRERNSSATTPRLAVSKDETGKVSVGVAAEEGRLQEAIEGLLRSLGLVEGDAAFVVLEQLSHLAVLQRDDAETVINGILGLVRGIKPQDAVEAMLAAQMVAVHHTMMDQVHRLALAGTAFEHELLTRLMVKLSRTFSQQVEALAVHRNRRRSTITVEHVHVEKGGQAIVGAVKQKVGVRKKTRGRPHERVRVPKRKAMLS